jgi:hypothetical protein
MAVVRIGRFGLGPADVAELIARRATLSTVIRASYPGLSDARLAGPTDGTFTDSWRWDSAEPCGRPLTQRRQIRRPPQGSLPGMPPPTMEIVDER